MEPENKTPNKNVQTYAEDMAKVIENDKEGGLIKKIIHEQEQYEVEMRNLSPEAKKNKIYIIVGVVLFLGALAILMFLGAFKKEVVPPEVALEYTPLIYLDKSYYQDINGLNKDQIAQSVLNEVNNTDVKEGGVEGIYLTQTADKKIIGFKKFIEDIKGNFDPLSYAFVDDDFLVGAFNGDTKNLFILLQVRSFADIFNGMKAWESKMFSDLHAFFDVDVTSDTSYLLTKSFEDALVQNKNARILKDKDGKVVMMYVFTDDDSIVITNSGDVITEVISRLVASQVKK